MQKCSLAALSREVRIHPWFAFLLTPEYRLLLAAKIDYMVQLIEKHKKEISVLCDRYGVAKLEIFGSGVDEARFDQTNSDLDFLVEFADVPNGSHDDRYFDLLFALQEMFHRNIDLVMPSAIKNVYFLGAIKKDREVIYAA